MKPISTKFIIFWVFLNIMIAALMDLALFTQTTPAMKKASFFKKVAVAEFWATLEWMFLIPSQRLGNKFLTATQLSLSSYIFDFLGQIVSNKFWLKIPTTLDDYIAMAIILGAMVISKLRLFG
uniref:Uncharacterized protein n=1 Tax=viral metagenome TaxID=1070528 RepID=A0A6C0KEE4_9ZZZZ